MGRIYRTRDYVENIPNIYVLQAVHYHQVLQTKNLLLILQFFQIKGSVIAI